MNILIVAATIPEISPIIDSFNSIEIIKNRRFKCEFIDGNLDFLITGVGMVATTYQLTKLLSSNKYDFVINVGIAGSFKKEIAMGEVVNVIADCFCELGAEDGENFIPMNELNIDSTYKIINSFINQKEPFVKLKQVNGITVNKVHGNAKSINGIVNRLNPDIETMEGASFMYVCLNEGVNFIQLRAISNFIEKRNKQNWNINLAIENINNLLIKWLKEKK